MLIRRKARRQHKIPFRLAGSKVIRLSPSAIQEWLVENQGMDYHRDKTPISETKAEQDEA